VKRPLEPWPIITTTQALFLLPSAPEIDDPNAHSVDSAHRKRERERVAPLVTSMFLKKC